MKFINLGSETSLDQDCGVEALCQVEEQKQFPVNFLLCITLTMDQPWVNYKSSMPHGTTIMVEP